MAIRIEDWHVSGNPYAAPEVRTLHLSGKIYGHQDFPNGSNVSTSAIDGSENGLIKTKSGSLYEIGSVNPDYEAKFPNAKARLLGGDL